MNVPFLLLCLVLGFLALERFLLHRNVRKVPLRITVNGTRGKSTTVRLIHAAFLHAGLVAVSRSTGSEAAFLLPDGTERPIDRRRGVHLVREQENLYAVAARLHADAVVGECSAIRPELQRVFSDKLMESTLVLLTNAWPDHIDLMGSTEEETAAALVAGAHGPFTTSDPYLLSFPGAVEAPQLPLGASVPGVPDSCVRLALAATRQAGIADGVALEGMRSYRPDVGMTGEGVVRGVRVYNAFARNDVESTGRLLASLDLHQATVVYANRRDREFRLVPFARLFARAGVEDVVVAGDHPGKCLRVFRHAGLSARNYEAEGGVPAGCRPVLVLCGNIKGTGERILAALQASEAPCIRT